MAAARRALAAGARAARDPRRAAALLALARSDRGPRSAAALAALGPLVEARLYPDDSHSNNLFARTIGGGGGGGGGGGFGGASADARRPAWARRGNAALATVRSFAGRMSTRAADLGASDDDDDETSSDDGDGRRRRSSSSGEGGSSGGASGDSLDAAFARR